MRGVRTEFWSWLESNFPGGGPRRHLTEVLGADVVAGLERTRVLQVVGRADRFPCDRARHDGCPREVIETRARIRAVCGSHPPQCEDLNLSDRDVESLTLRDLALCEALVAALGLRPPKSQPVEGIRSIYRVGTYHPVTGIRHPVYLVVRCRDGDYAEAIDALRARASEAFGLLVPTERFVSESVRRSLAEMGSVVVSLDDSIRVNSSGLVAVDGAECPFRSIGGGHRAGPVAAAVMVRALVKEPGKKPAWQDLDEPAYQRLLANGKAYDIVADARGRTVTKGKGKARKTARVTRDSYFDIVALALLTRGGFDPTDYEDRWSTAVQIFQRARQTIDLGGREKWALFQRRKPDGETHYYFEPDDGVSFALLFLPEQVSQKHSRDSRATR